MNDQQNLGDPLLPGHVNSYRRKLADLHAELNAKVHTLNKAFEADANWLWQEHCVEDAITGKFWLGDVLIGLDDIASFNYIGNGWIDVTLTDGAAPRFHKDSDAYNRFDSWYLREISK